VEKTREINKGGLGRRSKYNGRLERRMRKKCKGKKK
jgi:hypothetical protein